MLKGERTVSELMVAYEVHPTMIHQRKKALLEGAAGIFERVRQAAVTAEIAEEKRLRLRPHNHQLRMARSAPP